MPDPLMLAVPLGHWYWLPQEGGLLVYSQQATLGFEVESWVDAPYLWLENFYLALLYSQALGKISQLFIIMELVF